MDFFDKLRINSLAKKGDISGLLNVLNNRGRQDFEVKEAIFEKFLAMNRFSDIYHIIHDGAVIEKSDRVEIYSRMGDVTALNDLLEFSSTYATDKYLDAIQAIYDRNQSPELRQKIIEKAKSKIEQSIEKVGLILRIGVAPKMDYAGMREMFIIIDRLDGWDPETVELLVKRIDFYEKDIMPILTRMGMSVVEKLIPWLDNKAKGYVSSSWHQGNYNSMEDTYGEGWTETHGDLYPIAEGVRRALSEITGQRFTTAASARKWLEKQKTS